MNSLSNSGRSQNQGAVGSPGKFDEIFYKNFLFMKLEFQLMYNKKEPPVKNE
jgi:hypothetical protein